MKKRVLEYGGHRPHYKMTYISEDRYRFCPVCGKRLEPWVVSYGSGTYRSRLDDFRDACKGVKMLEAEHVEYKTLTSAA
jgi:hypothetical protein